MNKNNFLQGSIGRGAKIFQEGKKAQNQDFGKRAFAGIGENSFSVNGDEFSHLQILGGYIIRVIIKLEYKEEVKCSNIADKGQELLKIKDIVTEQKRSIKYKLKADTNI